MHIEDTFHRVSSSTFEHVQNDSRDVECGCTDRISSGQPPSRLRRGLTRPATRALVAAPPVAGATRSSASLRPSPPAMAAAVAAAAPTALREKTQDKTRITGAVTDPLGCDRNRDKTRIDGTLIGSQSPSRTADSSMVPRHYPHHYSRSVTTFSTMTSFIGTIRTGHEDGRLQPRPRPRSPTSTTTPICTVIKAKTEPSPSQPCPLRRDCRGRAPCARCLSVDGDASLVALRVVVLSRPYGVRPPTPVSEGEAGGWLFPPPDLSLLACWTGLRSFMWESPPPGGRMHADGSNPQSAAVEASMAATTRRVAITLPRVATVFKCLGHENPWGPNSLYHAWSSPHHPDGGEYDGPEGAQTI